MRHMAVGRSGVAVAQAEFGAGRPRGSRRCRLAEEVAAAPGDAGQGLPGFQGPTWTRHSISQGSWLARAEPLPKSAPPTISQSAGSSLSPSTGLIQAIRPSVTSTLTPSLSRPGRASVSTAFRSRGAHAGVITNWRR